jgi:hypothetical protein
MNDPVPPAEALGGDFIGVGKTEPCLPNAYVVA